MKYGIEAYFLPKKEAERAERHRIQIRHATVHVLQNGRAAISKLSMK